MAFTPVQVSKGGKTQTADTKQELVRLLWDGWLPSGGSVPVPTLRDLLGTEVEAALRAAYGRAAPVLADFVYDGSGNLTSYTEDGIPIVLTYNADGTVATSKRGTDATQTYTYSGGNLAGVA